MFSPSRALLLVLSSALLLLNACDSSTEPRPPQRINFDAQVLVLVLEGPNSFVLDDLASNRSYFPINLPQEFQVEGARVRIDGLRYEDIEVGLIPVVEILSIQSLGQSP
jgi:hypothetical protein